MREDVPFGSMRARMQTRAVRIGSHNLPAREAGLREAFRDWPTPLPLPGLLRLLVVEDLGDTVALVE